MNKIWINIIANFLEFFFARRFLIPLNTILLKLIIRFLGYNNHKDFYSSGEIHFLNKICKENPKICLDIGANVGKYSNYLLENSSTRIVAFEPLPKTFKELIKIKKNYPNRFYVYNIGLGQKKEKKYIYFDKNNLQWANFNPEVNKINYLKDNKKKFMCSVDTLDNFAKKNKKIINSKIDLIKIDTEGFELEVLRGAKKTIKRLKPKYIQLEYNWHHLFKNTNLYYFSKILNEYDTYKILPFSNKLLRINAEKPEHNYFNYSNIVFIRKK